MHLVHNLCRNLRQELVRKGVCIRSHEVCCLNRSQQDDVLVDPLVAHYTHSTAGIEGGEGLADFVVNACFSNGRDEDWQKR